jgi:hypothetical protein
MLSDRNKTLILLIAMCGTPRYYHPVPAFGERLPSLSLATPLTPPMSPLDTRLKPLLIAMSNKIRSYLGNPTIANSSS